MTNTGINKFPLTLTANAINLIATQFVVPQFEPWQPWPKVNALAWLVQGSGRTRCFRCLRNAREEFESQESSKKQELCRYSLCMSILRCKGKKDERMLFNNRLCSVKAMQHMQHVQVACRVWSWDCEILMGPNGWYCRNCHTARIHQHAVDWS